MDAETVDLLIVGAGPAGLSAALEARSRGLSVTLLDEQASAGGQIYRGINSAPAQRRTVLGADYSAGAEMAQMFSRSGALHISGAAVWNVDRSGRVNYLRAGANKVLKGRHVLLASGAMERPFPVKGWTLPGVMGAGAAQILYKSAGALPAEPVVLAGCGPLLYLLASQYLAAGVKIKALVHTTEASAYVRAAHLLPGALQGWKDLRKGIQMLDDLRKHKVAVYAGAQQFAIEGTDHAKALRFLYRGKEHRIESRLILLHQGVVPNTQFSWALRAKHRWDEAQLCWIPETDADGQIEDSGIYLAGDCRGIVGAKASASQGRLAAIAIASKLKGDSIGDLQVRAREVRADLRGHLRVRPFLDALYRPAESHRMPADDSVTVCRCEEVTAGQIRKYAELGCQGPNQTKAFGRCGMGPCQGRLCGLTVTELIAKSRGVPPSEVGYYRIRPPIKPVSLGELAA